MGKRIDKAEDFMLHVMFWILAPLGVVMGLFMIYATIMGVYLSVTHTCMNDLFTVASCN